MSNFYKNFYVWFLSLSILKLTAVHPPSEAGLEIVKLKKLHFKYVWETLFLEVLLLYTYKVQKVASEFLNSFTLL